MGHTYGTWLPGDPKGFRTRHHRQHIEGDYRNPPPLGTYDAWHAHAQQLMTRDPVYLDPIQRLLAVRLLVESLHRRDIPVAVAAVTDIHFHILTKVVDNRCRHWIGIAKRECSHYAKTYNAAPVGGLWAVRSKNLPIKNRPHQLNTGKYIYDHIEQGGAIWINGHLIAPREMLT